MYTSTEYLALTFTPTFSLSSRMLGSALGFLLYFILHYNRVDGPYVISAQSYVSHYTHTHKYELIMNLLETPISKSEVEST